MRNVPWDLGRLGLKSVIPKQMVFHTGCIIKSCEKLNIKFPGSCRQRFQFNGHREAQATIFLRAQQVVKTLLCSQSSKLWGNPCQEHQRHLEHC